MHNAQYAYTSRKCAHLRFIMSVRNCAHFIASTHVYNYFEHNCARIFTKILLVLNFYSSKFHKDLSSRCGYIPLFITIYNTEDKTLGVFSSWIMAKSKTIILSFWDTFRSIFHEIFN